MRGIEILTGSSVELLGESDEDPFRAADVAEAVGLLILDDFTDELGATLAEYVEGIVDVVDGEHDTEVAEGVHGGIAVIGDDGWMEEAGELDSAMSIGRAQHGDLDALIGETGDTAGPIAFDGGATFELEAESEEEVDGGIEVGDDDGDVVQALEGH